jgi:hypothetical protein
LCALELQLENQISSEGPAETPGLFHWAAMLDDNWDLINGTVAHEIEILTMPTRST